MAPEAPRLTSHAATQWCLEPFGEEVKRLRPLYRYNMCAKEMEKKELSMKFKGFPSCLALLSFLILLGGVPRAVAEERHHLWSVGLRGGGSFLTQDAVRNANVEGQLGPSFNGVIVYDVHEHLSFGFEAEWEQHKLDQAALTLGKASTASLLIRFEGHLARAEPFSPYFLLAGGYNLNSFSADDGYLAEYGEDCRIDIDNAFALKAGFGVDMFVLFENAAINFEVAWKYNRADLDFLSGGNTVASDSYDGSAVSFLIGFRYHFPVEPF